MSSGVQAGLSWPPDIGPVESECGNLREAGGDREEALQRGADRRDPTGSGRSCHKGGGVASTASVSGDS